MKTENGRSMADNGRFRNETAGSLTRPRISRPVDGAEEETFNVVSAHQIGETNRRRILQTLFDLGPTSRADLARISGSKRTTISGIVQPLLDGGLLVEEAPTQAGGVGKPAHPLWFSADASPVCALTLMPDGVQSAIVSLRGEIYGLKTRKIDNGNTDPGHYLAAMEHCIAASLSSSRNEILGIGIAVDGMIDPATGSIVTMNLAPWMAGVELSRILETRFGAKTILDHHPRAILMGERWFGKGRGLKDFAVIYADEGLACSLFLNGEPFRGPRGSGGELGHTVVSVRGDACTCGRRGCWETIATLRWLRKRAAELGLADADTIDVPRACELARSSAAAQTLLSEYAYNLAVGIANLQTLLMPGNFIIYGNAARGSAHLLEMIQANVNELAFRHPGQAIEVTFGTREQQAIALQGAAGLVIAEELKIRY